MKSLFLKLRTKGLHDLGLDIIWENPLFDFVGFNDLGVFDQLNAALQDGIQGRLVIGASNTTKRRHVSGEHEFIEIEFAWAEGAAPEVVEFAVENVTAKNKAGADVPIVVFPKPFVPEDASTVEFVWRET